MCSCDFKINKKCSYISIDFSSYQIFNNCFLSEQHIGSANID